MSAASPTTLPTIRRSQGAELSAIVALFWLTIKQHLHGRRLLVLIALYSLPCILVVLHRTLSDRTPLEELEFVFMLNLLPHGLAPLTALLYGAGIVRDEVEDQTLTYLLLRAMPRWAIYVTKMLATMFVTTVLMAFAVVALYTCLYYGTPDFGNEVLKQRMPRVIGIFSLAQLAYCTLFGLAGLWTTRSLVFGIIYIAAVEGILASMDFVLRSLTVVYYVRSLLIQWARLPEEVLHETKQEWALTLDKLVTPDQAVWRLVGFAVVGTLLAGWWFSRREYRVKTPGV